MQNLIEFENQSVDWQRQSPAVLEDMRKRLGQPSAGQVIHVRSRPIRGLVESPLALDRTMPTGHSRQAVLGVVVEDFEMYRRAVGAWNIVPIEAYTVDMSYHRTMDCVISIERLRDANYLQIAETLKTIAALEHIDTDWDGTEGETPSPITIVTAQGMLTSLAALVAREHMPWIDPHISVTPFGDIIFEWWGEDKQLSIYISGDEAEYIQTWGEDDSVDQIDGDATSDETRWKFWSWFTA